MSELLSPSLIQRLRSFDSPTISNAIEALNIRDRTEGYASMELRCLFPELSPMVGRAVTCKADSTSPGLRRSNGLREKVDAIVAMPKPVVVVIQNCGPDRLRSCFAGDMASVVYEDLGRSGHSDGRRNPRPKRCSKACSRLSSFRCGKRCLPRECIDR